MTKGYTGTDANPNSIAYKNPYKQDVTYNAFSEVTAITGNMWGTALRGSSKSYETYTGRVANTGYDAAGNIVSEQVRGYPTIINRTMTYDAAGRQVVTYGPAVHTCCESDNTSNVYYDGDGQKVRTDGMSGSVATVPTYEIRSTVLGGETVGEYRAFAEYPKKIFTVPVVGGKLKYTNIVNYSESISFTRTSPEGLIEYDGDNPTVLYDPRGADVGLDEPTEPGFVPSAYGWGNDPGAYDRCAEGGVLVSCDKQARFDKRANEIFNQIWTQWAKEAAISAASSAHRRGAASGDPQRKINREVSQSPEARATIATDKPASDPEIAGLVDSGLVPDASGNNDGCTWSNSGNPNCTVESQRWLYSDVDASRRGVDANDSKIEDSTLELLRRNLDTLAKDSRCGAFLNALLGNIANEKTVGGQTYTKFSGSIAENLDRIKNAGGLWLRDMTARGVSVHDKITMGKGDFAPGETSTSPYTLSKRFPMQTPFRMSGNLYTTLNLVHELVHMYYPAKPTGSVGVDRGDMARAAQLALQQAGLTNGLIPRDGMSGSEYYDQALKYACSGVKL